MCKLYYFRIWIVYGGEDSDYGLLCYDMVVQQEHDTSVIACSTTLPDLKSIF